MGLSSPLQIYHPRFKDHAMKNQWKVACLAAAGVLGNLVEFGAPYVGMQFGAVAPNGR